MRHLPRTKSERSMGSSAERQEAGQLMVTDRYLTDKNRRFFKALNDPLQPLSGAEVGSAARGKYSEGLRPPRILRGEAAEIPD